MAKNTSQSEISKYRIVIGITITLIVISKCLLFYYYTEFKRLNQELMAEKTANLKLVKEFQNSQGENQNYSSLVVLRDRNNDVVRMIGFNDQQEAVATIYWDTQTQDIYIDVLDLPEPPKGKAYHLWASTGEKTIDAGVLELKSGLQKLSKVDNAESFMVTLEEAGNKPTLHSNQLYLKAVVEKSS